MVSWSSSRAALHSPPPEGVDGHEDVAAQKAAPEEVAVVVGHQQLGPVAPLAVDAVDLLEDGLAAGIQILWVMGVSRSATRRFI